MTNATYLQISYFAVGAAVAVVALVAWRVLRRSFAGVCDDARPAGLGRILRRCLLLGILLPAMAGFFAVSFHSCSKDSYAKIIEDRDYVVSKNQEQLSTSLRRTAGATLAWGFVAVALLLSGRCAHNARGTRPPMPPET